MDIVDLTEDYRGVFSVCLEDWSAEAVEAGPRRAQWVAKFLPRGLRAKLAVDEAGSVGGMIQYLPIEQFFVDGEGLYFIPCIWVHGHPQGPGNCQGRGMGSALLAAAEADAKRMGAKGMAAWGLWLPVWMRSSWFKKHGYIKADRQGILVLLWKPFSPEARPPRWFRIERKVPPWHPGKVPVTVFVTGWCNGMNLVAERARRAAGEFGERVEDREIDTSERGAAAAWGNSDALFIGGTWVRTGPPPSYEKIRRVIEKKVRRL